MNLKNVYSLIYKWRHYRRIFFSSADRLPFGFYAILYTVFFLFLVWSRVGEYGQSISSLLGIYEGFATLNPLYRQESFVLYKDGGYDGQFFFFISEYLFHSKITTPPILDSFRLRFVRIGMPILSGFFSSIFSFQYYSEITLCLVLGFHVSASFVLKKMLSPTQKGIYLLFLFSPFSINANLLLVSDGLFASCFFLWVYAVKRAGLSIAKPIILRTSRITKKELFLPLLLGSIFFLSIRETSLPFFGTIFLLALLGRQFYLSVILSIALGLYICFYLFVGTYSGFPEGTNPLGFLELSDFPFFGFFKSLHIPEPLNLSGISRELSKFPLLLLLVSLGLQTQNMKSLEEKILALPLYFFVFLGSIAEAGYWLSFDNSSRFFTLVFPYTLLISRRMPGYRHFGAIELVFLLFIAVVLRFLVLKQGMNYTIW